MILCVCVCVSVFFPPRPPLGGVHGGMFIKPPTEDFVLQAKMRRIFSLVFGGLATQ